MSPTTSTPSSTQTFQQAQLEQLLAIIQSSQEIGPVTENIGKAGRDYNTGLLTIELKNHWDETLTPTTVAKDTRVESKGIVADTITDIMSWTKSKWNSLFGTTNAADTAVKTATTTIKGVDTAKDIASTSGLLGDAASVGSKFLNVAGIAYGAYDLIKNFGQMTLEHGALSGAAVGAGIGSIFPGIGTLVGGVVGGIAGGIMSLFRKSGKHKDQKARDTMRKALQGAGILDEKFTIGLADGSRYDIGIDGGPKAQFGGRRPFEIDLKDPLAVKISTLATPLANVVCGGDPKLASDLAGYLANAAMSNAGGDEAVARKNMLAMYSQFKVSPEQLLGSIGQLVQCGKMDKQLAEGFISVLKDLFSQSPKATEQKKSTAIN